MHRTQIEKTGTDLITVKQITIRQTSTDSGVLICESAEGCRVASNISCSETILWWHISAITCQIIMSTCHIIMSTSQKNIITTSSQKSYFYIVLMPLTAVYLPV